MASYAGNRRAIVMRALNGMSKRSRYGRKGPKATINPPRNIKPRPRVPRP